MNRNIGFVTGSYYQGTYNTATNCMVSQGRYTFPDGSIYQGFFRRGVFHGIGIFKLAAPYKMIFKVRHYNGRLISMEKIVFEDGLRFNGNIRNKAIETDSWTYLTRYNRFYPIELIQGAQSVGPSSLLTVTPEPQTIPEQQLDVGEGFYNPITRFVKDRRPPLKDKRFVCDDDEVEWIEKHCRVSDDLELVIPSMEDCEKILRLNRKELALINPEIECPCEADNKPQIDLENDNFSMSSISSSSICDEDVRVSDIVSKSTLRKSLPFYSISEGLGYQALIDRQVYT